ncbi:MAG: hypothetical protein KAR40_11145 [Candidatus Sabulitectum sp.]|nr:hypothetical protein [Candidatus Sabulitectum sp.]
MANTHVVDHDSLYLMVKGTLTHVERGTELTLPAAAAKKLEASGKVKSLGKAKSADVGSEVTPEVFAAAVAKLNKENKDHYTNAGLPELKALKALDININAATRDALWEALNAE